MALGQLGVPVQKKKKKPRRDLTLLTKSYLKRTTDLKVKCKTAKLLQGTIRENLDDPGFGNDV